jgi:hypothetical protein
MKVEEGKERKEEKTTKEEEIPEALTGVHYPTAGGRCRLGGENTIGKAM